MSRVREGSRAGEGSRVRRLSRRRRFLEEEGCLEFAAEHDFLFLIFFFYKGNKTYYL